MAKAKSYSFQGREWTVKDLAEELGLSTPRVHGLLKEHNEDIKAIFESRGITPKPADKGPKARLFDYKGKQWTVKQLAEEFELSNVRVNRLIKEHDGDIEKIVLSKEKSKKTTETKKAPKTEKTDEKKEIAVDEKEINSFRWFALHQSPAYMFDKIVSLARLMKNFIDSKSGAGKEDLLNYFAEWCSISQGGFEVLFTEVVNTGYKHNQIDKTAISTVNFMRTMSDLFSALNRLDFIGKRKDTGIFVKEREESSTLNRTQRNRTFLAD